MTLATKAARGAGAPAAQAAAFGRAAVFHLWDGHPEQDLMLALQALPHGPIIALPVTLARMIEDGETHLPMADPTGLTLSYIAAHPLLERGTDAEDAPKVVLRREAKPAEPVVRLNVSEELVTYLQSLAAKTLVPDSAASRAAGAGAGLSDND